MFLECMGDNFQIIWQVNFYSLFRFFKKNLKINRVDFNSIRIRLMSILYFEHILEYYWIDELRNRYLKPESLFRPNLKKQGNFKGIKFDRTKSYNQSIKFFFEFFWRYKK